MKLRMARWQVAPGRGAEIRAAIAFGPLRPQTPSSSSRRARQRPGLSGNKQIGAAEGQEPWKAAGSRGVREPATLRRRGITVADSEVASQRDRPASGPTTDEGAYDPIRVLIPELTYPRAANLPVWIHATGRTREDLPAPWAWGPHVLISGTQIVHRKKVEWKGSRLEFYVSPAELHNPEQSGKSIADVIPTKEHRVNH